MSAPVPSSPPRPPQGAPDPGRVRTGRALLWQSVALLGMVLSFSLVLPWKLIALALGLVALVLGVRVWVTSRGAERSGLPRAVASAGAVSPSISLEVPTHWAERRTGQRRR